MQSNAPQERDGNTWVMARQFNTNAVVTFAVLILLSGSMSFAGDQQRLPDDVLKVIEKVKAARASLRSGRIEVDYQIKLRHADDAKSRDTRRSLSYVFNRDAKSLWIRQHSKERFFVGAGVAFNQPTEADYIAVLVRTPEYMCSWNSFGKQGEADSFSCHIELRDPVTRHQILHFDEFDINAFGMMVATEYSSSLSLQGILDMWSRRADKTEVIPQQDKTIEVKFSGKQNVRVFGFDPAREWICHRAALYEPNGDGGYKDLPKCETVTEWTIQDFVLLPKRTTSRMDYGGTKQRSLTRQLTFQWRDVNNVSPDHARFSMRSIDDAWPGMSVIERREGKRETIGKVTEDGIELNDSTIQ